ncbi:MAG: PilZ domain-containing protein [Treponema sp.]|jgi:hypothetical protein|nr:PilZ domain-containing protein [Treponema sp.]
MITSQKITSYYDRFKDIEVTFTKDLIQVTGLITQDVYLKCGSDVCPCIIFSSSFVNAKIVASIKAELLKKLEDANNSVSLRWCFKNPDGGSPVAFFISARSAGFSPYGNSENVALFTLQFTQRPPDNFIEIMGRILDANFNFAKRKDERILINADSQRKLNVLAKETTVFIEKVPRHCILRDLSFSGAKIIMMGVAKFLLNKFIALRVDFDEPRECFLIKGQFIRSELVEGRKDLVALAVRFEENAIPIGYKIRINDYVSQVRLEIMPEVDATAS